MILLVEDNPDDVKLTQRAFRQQNITTELVIASDGVEALDFLFARGTYSNRTVAQQPALVILDVQLPRIDGIEVLRQIRANHSTHLLPVIMFTTSEEESDVLKSYRTGANSYVRKPLEYETFSSVIGSMVAYWLNYNIGPNL